MKQIHPLAEIFPALEGTSLHELIADIKVNGLREAIWLHKDGRILDGRNRYIACNQIPIKATYRTYEGEDALAFVLSMNLARRHLNESQRAMVAARIAVLNQGEKRENKPANLQVTPTQKEAAKTLNISERTISDARKVQQRASKEIIASVDRGDMAVSVAAKLTDKPKEMQREIIKKMEFTGKSAPEVLKSMSVHVSNNSGENEWYTPPEFIEAARKTMGSIDLDPASSKIANKIVKAKKFYTVEDDGLRQEWEGNVWMNPPYSSPEIKQFSRKVTTTFADTIIAQAIILVNNATETQWFQEMLAETSAVCFPSSRIKFLDKQGSPGAPLQGQAILYMGVRVSDFIDNFKQFGVVLYHDI